MLPILMTASLRAQTPQARVIASSGDPITLANTVVETWVAPGPARTIAVYIARALGSSSTDGIGYAIANPNGQGGWVWDEYGMLNDVTPFPLGDPVVAASEDGDFMVVAFRIPGPTEEPAIARLYTRRYDGKANEWDDEWLEEAAVVSLEKPWIVAGEYVAPIGQFPGKTEYYVTYGSADGFGYMRTRNGGSSWTKGTIPNIGGSRIIQPSVWGAGDVFAAYISGMQTGNNFEISFVQGADIDIGTGTGGVSWSRLEASAETPLTVTLNHPKATLGAKLPGRSTAGEDSDPEVNVFTIPWLAVDPTSADRLFLVYHDTATSNSGDDDVNIYCQVLTRNTSTGYWSAGARVPVSDAVDEPPAHTDQFTPSINVDAAGRLHVIWFDDRDFVQPDGEQDPSPKFDVYYAYSEDSGATFVQNAELAESNPSIPALDMELYDTHGAGEWYHFTRPGEYNGIAARGNTVWTTFYGTDADQPTNENPSLIWSSLIPFGTP